jgi:hypothetical protein
VRVGEIRGVLSRLPQVGAHELPLIASDEQAYVASEIMAFLVAWLASLPCRVLNRPTPLDLTGPAWHREQWIRCAGEAGLRVQPLGRVAPSFAGIGGQGDVGSHSTPESAWTESVALSLIGERVLYDPALGPLDDAILGGVRRLARRARVEVMTAQFCRSGDDLMFCGAANGVDLGNATVADAIAQHLDATT